MKARHHAQVALLTLAAFAVGLTWARNWPALIGLAIGAVMMTLIMGLMHSAKRKQRKMSLIEETQSAHHEGYCLGRSDKRHQP